LPWAVFELSIKEYNKIKPRIFPKAKKFPRFLKINKNIYFDKILKSRGRGIKKEIVG
jgi:hypothetical protein